MKLDRDGVQWYCHNCDKGGGEKYEQPESSDLGPIKATYDYTDEAGNLLFQTLRFEPLNAPKQFRQRTAPDQKKWSIKGVRIVPYRLPELIEDLAAEHVVFVVEGEKDVITLRQHGVPATTNPMGAGKWWSEFNDILRGADVVICGDNDQPGRDHIQLVAKSLHGVARRVRVLDLAQFWPEIEESDDITDWFEGGGTVERLWEIVGELSDWTPDGNGRVAASPCGSEPQAAGAVQKPSIKTAAALRTMTFAPLKYIVPGLIVEGLVLLAGKPKVRKSWMALDIALSVADGRFCLGDRECQEGDVLYLALEDGDRRLQRRMTKLLPTFGAEWPNRFHYATQWLRADQGGVEQIDQWCGGHPDARLIVIDILAKFRAPSRGKNNFYEQDYAALLKLQELATRRSITILVIHHTRKGESEDPVEEISGTLGLSGSADAFMVLKRASSGATLVGRGRDLEDVDLAVQFSNETCRWTILGAASEVHRSAERGRVLAALEGALDGLSPSEVADITGLTRVNSRQLLIRMAKSNEIQKAGRGRYFHPSVTSPVTSVTLSPARKNRSKTECCVDEKSDSDKVTDVTGITPPLVPVPGGEAPPADDGYPGDPGPLPAFLDRNQREPRHD